MRKIIIKFIDWFYNLIPIVKNLIPHDIFTYGFTGGFNMLLDIFLFWIFYNFIFCQKNIDLYFCVLQAHNLTVITVFPITFCTGFLLQKYITFSRSNIKGKIQLFRYAISVIGSIILTLLLVDFFIDKIGLWGTVAKIITTILVTIYSFCMQKFYTFKIKKY